MQFPTDGSLASNPLNGTRDTAQPRLRIGNTDSLPVRAPLQGADRRELQMLERVLQLEDGRWRSRNFFTRTIDLSFAANLRCSPLWATSVTAREGQIFCPCRTIPSQP